MFITLHYTSPSKRVFGEHNNWRPIDNQLLFDSLICLVEIDSQECFFPHLIRLQKVRINEVSLCSFLVSTTIPTNIIGIVTVPNFVSINSRRNRKVNLEQKLQLVSWLVS